MPSRPYRSTSNIGQPPEQRRRPKPPCRRLRTALPTKFRTCAWCKHTRMHTKVFSELRNLAARLPTHSTSAPLTSCLACRPQEGAGGMIVTSRAPSLDAFGAVCAHLDKVALSRVHTNSNTSRFVPATAKLHPRASTLPSSPSSVCLCCL